VFFISFSRLSCILVHTHTHPFNGPLSGSTRVSRYQKGKTNLDFTGARDSEWPVKTERWGAGMVICLERGADLHVVQLMPLPLTVSCFSKIHIGYTFLVPAHLGDPGQRAVKRVCVCVWIITTAHLKSNEQHRLFRRRLKTYLFARY